MTYLAAAPDLTNISIANAGIVALLGYAVVFFGLILLMLVVTAMGKVFVATDAKAKAAPAPKALVAAFCTNCGAKLTGGKFCSNCGTKIE